MGHTERQVPAFHAIDKCISSSPIRLYGTRQLADRDMSHHQNRTARRDSRRLGPSGQHAQIAEGSGRRLAGTVPDLPVWNLWLSAAVDACGGDSGRLRICRPRPEDGCRPPLVSRPLPRERTAPIAECGGLSCRRKKRQAKACCDSDASDAQDPGVSLRQGNDVSRAKHEKDETAFVGVHERQRSGMRPGPGHRRDGSSPSRTRTYNLAVNSRSLYRLSYRGIYPSNEHHRDCTRCSAAIIVGDTLHYNRFR